MLLKLLRSNSATANTAGLQQKILNLLHDTRLEPFALKHTKVHMLSTVPKEGQKRPITVICNTLLDLVHFQQDQGGYVQEIWDGDS